MEIETVKHLFDQYGYFFLFFGAYFEGFHIMVLGGFLSALGYIHIVPAYISLMLGNFTADLTWFLIGYLGGEKAVNWLSKYKQDLPEKIDKAKTLLHKYHLRILFIVKVTTGLAIGTIIAAAITKLGFKKFFFADLLSNVVLVAAILLLGYGFGQSYYLVYKYFRYVSLILLPIFIGGIFLANKYADHLLKEK